MEYLGHDLGLIAVFADRGRADSDVSVTVDRGCARP